MVKLREMQLFKLLLHLDANAFIYTLSKLFFGAVRPCDELQCCRAMRVRDEDARLHHGGWLHQLPETGLLPAASQPHSSHNHPLCKTCVCVVACETES